MYRLQFEGTNWSEKDLRFLREKLAFLTSNSAHQPLQLWYRNVGIPYKASFSVCGKDCTPVAYAIETLVENIHNCLPVERE